MHDILRRPLHAMLILGVIIAALPATAHAQPIAPGYRGPPPPPRPLLHRPYRHRHHHYYRPRRPY